MPQYRNIFDTPVSVFTATPHISNGKVVNTQTQTHEVQPIGQYLATMRKPQPIIARLRATMRAAVEAWNKGDRQEYDRLILQYQLHKWDNPFAILQGVCPGRKDSEFSSYSDIICLDIDTEKPHKTPNGNEWVTDWPGLRDELAANPFIAYCSLSAGGQGLFVLIPIESHEHHNEHWKALCTLFKRVYGLNIDTATKNMARLRFMSYDPLAHINTNAQVFTARESEQPRPTAFMNAQPFAPGDDTERRIEKAVQIIEQRGVDITQDYNEWLKASAAIAHHMGERGRTIFHRIARQYPGYNERENDRLYSSIMRDNANGREASINSFFYLCQRYGVNVGHERRCPIHAPQVRPFDRNASAPGLSQVERYEMNAHRQQLATAQDIVNDEAVKQLRQCLDLDVCQIDEWELTQEEIKAFAAM